MLINNMLTSWASKAFSLVVKFSIWGFRAVIPLQKQKEWINEHLSTPHNTRARVCVCVCVIK